MERHERYDPEDIESLLSERGFDELLPDERAFVLRHMSGREEYERMRALLHYVRPDERDRGTIEPEDRVRTHVLAAFRAQQRPQWRIWLNTLASWATPREASAMWRPALAFATVALLIVAGLVVVRQFNAAGPATELAELKKEEVQPMKPVTDAADEANKVPLEEVSAGVPPTSGVPVATEETVPGSSRTSVPSGDAYTGSVVLESLAEAETMNEDLAAAAVEEQTAAISVPTQPVPTISAEAYSHLVTADELSKNMSTTNATGAVTAGTSGKRSAKAKVEQSPSTSRSMADDPQILELVTAGW